MSMTTTDTTTETEAAAERCGQCGAPAAHDQRYCVNCGFHRRNAPDPVARYLSEASAARAQVAAAVAAAAARRRRLPRLGPRVVALLVALALVVGILIGNATAGKSSSGATPASSHKTTQKHKSTTVKNATGSAYQQQEENLPNTVTP
jgi:ribosomal protein L37E